MEQTISDTEIIEALDYDVPPMCEHSRHLDNPKWHSDENGVFEIMVYCAKCPQCDTRMPIKDSYEVLDRVR